MFVEIVHIYCSCVFLMLRQPRSSTRTDPLFPAPTLVRLRRGALFLERARRKMGKPLTGLSEDAKSAMIAYRLPGNVRELENLMERMAILYEGEEIGRANV